MTAILISIRPEWVAKILNGEKTIEIRKNAPKCELPMDVYIHCTKGKRRFVLTNENYAFFGNFYFSGDRELNGKVVAKFTLRKIEKLEDAVDICLDDGDCDLQTESLPPWVLRIKSSLTRLELEDYVGEGKAYAWHISDLEIFDKPKELSEFRYKKVTRKWDENYHRRIVKKEIIAVKRPPQSWQYVDI